jgi:CubicO group peptidase (beta-lactamase class C family)
MKRVFLSFLCFALIMNIYCQNISQSLDNFYNSIYRYNQLNGNVLVAENGHIIYEKSFGFANYQKNLPNDSTSRFTLSSISKIFTSTAILQLKDRGKLKLDDYVVKYFPDFPYTDITIRHLLSHTSGLPDYQLYEEQIVKNPNKIFSNKDVLPSIKIWGKPLDFKPGEKWEYSNTNFCLLALLVEKLSGLEFQKYLKRYIFSPVNMTNTYFQSDSAKIEDSKRVINYDYPWLYSTKMQDVDSLKKYRWRLYNASGFIGQGNIITTTEDLFKFDKVLYSGKILKLSTLKEALTPTKLNSGENNNANTGIGKASYGLGWFILKDTTAGKIVWHTGGQPGAVSIFLRNISKMQTVIMFDNTFNKSLFANAVNALGILDNKPVHFSKISIAHDYGITLVEKGVDAAFCRLTELRADTVHYYVNEDEINELGLQLLYATKSEGYNNLALEVLKLNTLIFPNSFNTYDSYGEALAKLGKTNEAIFMYEKSLTLNPENEGGKRALKDLTAK